MVRGIRPRATVLNPAVQPQAQYLYDPITRRAVRYVETIVPTVALADSDNTVWASADQFYAQLGAPSGFWPRWAGQYTLNCTMAQWDSTNKVGYVRVSTGAGGTYGVVENDDAHMFWRTGIAGPANSYTPKNATATALHFYARARFANLGGNQIISLSTTSSPTALLGATDHGFGVYVYGTTDWGLQSADGSTLSYGQSSLAADTAWHEFHVAWTDGALDLFVDGANVLTKTTNLPAKPLGFRLRAYDSNTLDVADALVKWS